VVSWGFLGSHFGCFVEVSWVSLAKLKRKVLEVDVDVSWRSPGVLLELAGLLEVHDVLQR